MNQTKSTNVLISLAAHLGVSLVGITTFMTALHGGPKGGADVGGLALGAFLIGQSLFHLYLHAHEDQPWVKRVEALEAQFGAAIAASGGSTGLTAGVPPISQQIARLPIASLVPAPTAAAAAAGVSQGGAAAPPYPGTTPGLPAGSTLGLLLLAFCWIGAMELTGCATQSPTVTGIEVAAADLGSIALQTQVTKEVAGIVKSDPNSGAYFLLSSQVILADVGNGQYNPTNLIADINLTSFKEAHGGAAVAIANVVDTYETVWVQALLSKNTNFAAVLRPVATAIANGMAAGAAAAH